MVVDLNGPQPTVTPTADLDQERTWSTPTVMADGRVLVSGGSAVSNQLIGVAYAATIWDPATGQWTLGASAVKPRLYHSIAMLLPDGSELNDRLLQLRQEEGDSYRTLARVRLSAPHNDQLIQRLTAIDGRVRAALQQRSSSTTEIDLTIAAIEAEAKALQAERSRATAVVEQRQGTLRAAEDATRQRLEQTPAYQQQMRAAQQADQIAVGAEQKTQQAENDRREKRQALRAGRAVPVSLEARLRHFGVRGRSVHPNDGRVDRAPLRVRQGTCRLRDAAGDSPEARPHAKRQREQVQAEAQRLAEMRQTALQSEETAAPRAEVAEAEKQVDAIDDKIEANGKKALDATGRAHPRRRCRHSRGDRSDRDRTQAPGAARAPRRSAADPHGRRRRRRSPSRTPPGRGDAAPGRHRAGEVGPGDVSPTIDRDRVDPPRLPAARLQPRHVRFRRRRADRLAAGPAVGRRHEPRRVLGPGTSIASRGRNPEVGAATSVAPAEATSEARTFERRGSENTARRPSRAGKVDGADPRSVRARGEGRAGRTVWKAS